VSLTSASGDEDFIRSWNEEVIANGKGLFTDEEER